MARQGQTFTFQKYELEIEELGKGSYGIVYKGTHVEDNITIAAKKTKYKDRNNIVSQLIKNMGQKEKDIIEKLKGHSNIVKLLDYIDDDSSHWFVMEYCDLGDLSAYLTRYSPNFQTKLRIICECFSAITYMHSFNPPIVHRDIKPANVLLKIENNRPVVKITDFGIGKMYEMDAASFHMTMNTVAGTKPFWPPEFFEMDSSNLKYHPGVDIFSLGLLASVVLLYHTEHCQDLIPLSGKK